MPCSLLRRPGWDEAGEGTDRGAGAAWGASGPYPGPYAAPDRGVACSRCLPSDPRLPRGEVDAFELDGIQLRGSHSDPKKGAGEDSHCVHVQARLPLNLTMRG